LLLTCAKRLWFYDAHMLTNYWSVSKTAETDPSRPRQNHKIPVSSGLERPRPRSRWLHAKSCTWLSLDNDHSDSCFYKQTDVLVRRILSLSTMAAAEATTTTTTTTKIDTSQHSRIHRGTTGAQAPDFSHVRCGGGVHVGPTTWYFKEIMWRNCCFIAEGQHVRYHKDGKGKGRERRERKRMTGPLRYQNIDTPVLINIGDRH